MPRVTPRQALDHPETRLTERDGSVALGRNGKPDLFVHVHRPLSGSAHLAIASPDHRGRFHAAGLAAGGRDNGAPSLRLQYHQHYYGALDGDSGSSDRQKLGIRVWPSAVAFPGGASWCPFCSARQLRESEGFYDHRHHPHVSGRLD